LLSLVNSSPTRIKIVDYGGGKVPRSSVSKCDKHNTLSIFARTTKPYPMIIKLLLWLEIPSIKNTAMG
jgi:hypothetical protein